MTSDYYWGSLFVLLILFVAVLNALLDIRKELRRMNDRAEIEKRAALFERQRRGL